MSEQSYREYRESIKEEQQGKAYDDIKQDMEQRNRHILELDHLQPQNHIWVDRGAVMSCENAGHPNHHAYKKR